MTWLPFATIAVNVLIGIIVAIIAFFLRRLIADIDGVRAAVNSLNNAIGDIHRRVDRVEAQAAATAKRLESVEERREICRSRHDQALESIRTETATRYVNRNEFNDLKRMAENEDGLLRKIMQDVAGILSALQAQAEKLTALASEQSAISMRLDDLADRISHLEGAAG